jgi:hypothetical protein
LGGGIVGRQRVPVWRSVLDYLIQATEALFCIRLGTATGDRDLTDCGDFLSSSGQRWKMKWNERNFHVYVRDRKHLFEQHYVGMARSPQEVLTRTRTYCNGSDPGWPQAVCADDIGMRLPEFGGEFPQPGMRLARITPLP